MQILAYKTYKVRNGKLWAMALPDGPQHQRLVNVRHPHLAFEEPTKRVEFKAHERDYGGQAWKQERRRAALGGALWRLVRRGTIAGRVCNGLMCWEE